MSFEACPTDQLIKYKSYTAEIFQKKGHIEYQPRKSCIPLNVVK